jgi:MFS family permease
VAGARALALDISPLRDSKSYRALWLGQVVSLIGTQMRFVAVPWQVFQLTGSTAAVGLVGLVEVVPLIAFSILGGAFADVTDRKKVVGRANAGLLLTSLALALLTFSGEATLVGVYAITAVASALAAIERPARSAMMPNLIREDQLPAAMALRQVAFQTTMIVGPAIGGVMIASFSLGWVYVIDAFTFIAAQLSLRWIPRMVPERGAESGGWAAIREGLKFSFRTPVLLSIFLIDLVAMVFGMPRAVFPALAEEVFRTGARGVGLLYAAPAVGALVAALLGGWVTRIRKQGPAVVISVAAWGSAIALAGLSLWSLWLTLAFLALAGAADVYSAIFRGTMLLQSTPDALRGRVSAVNIMVVTGGPRVGDVEAGIAASLVGAGPSVFLGGAACLVGTALIAWRFPALRRYRTAASAEAPFTPT